MKDSINPTMSFKNQPVKEFQTYLRKISQSYGDIPSVEPDGIYGPETTAAVAAFQRQFHLPVTGKVNLETWSRIFSVYEEITLGELPPESLQPYPKGNVNLKEGDTGEKVFILQAVLSEIAERYQNFDAQGITGVYDAGTADNIRRIQRMGRLPETGEVDRKTWEQLTKIYNEVVR